MKKIWLNKAASFSVADEFDQSYYSEMLPSEKLDALQWMREEYFRSQKMRIGNESGKRLRRVFKIIKSKKASGRKQDEADLELLRK